MEILLHISLRFRREHMPESALHRNARKQEISESLFQVFHQAPCWQMSDAPFFSQKNPISSHLSEKAEGPLSAAGGGKKTLCSTVFLLHYQEKKSPVLASNDIFSSIPYLYWKFLPCLWYKKSWYIFLSCAPTPRKTVLLCFLQDWWVWQTQYNSMAVWKMRAGIYTPDTSAFVWSGSGLCCSCCNIKFCPHEGGLYSGGGVWMWVGQGVVLPSAGEAVERVERAESTDSAWDHGNGVGGHERDVIWWAPHSESVVWRAGSPQYHVVGVQGVAPAVAVQVRVLLHLQGHDLLLLSVS